MTRLQMCAYRGCQGVQAAYEQYKKTEEYKNFGIDTIINKAIPELSNLSGLQESLISNDAWVILKNDYPYHVEPEISHYVAWFISSHSILQSSAIEILHAHVDGITFQNSVERSSIKTVPHLHLFTKTGTTPCAIIQI